MILRTQSWTLERVEEGRGEVNAIKPLTIVGNWGLICPNALKEPWRMHLRIVHPKDKREKYLSIPITLQGLPSYWKVYICFRTPKWVSASILLSVGGEALGRTWEIHSEAKVQCGPVIHATGDPATAEVKKRGSRGCLCKWYLVQPPKEGQSSPKPYFHVTTWFLFLQSFCTTVLAHVINSKVFSIVLFSSFHFSYHSKKKRRGKKETKTGKYFASTYLH